MAEISEEIFREYDVRGRYGVDLTLEVAELLGRAYAELVRARGLGGESGFRAAVGRDVRLSSTPIRDALIKGLTEGGIDCIDAGVCPTPLQYYAMRRAGADGGVMITGSHNPPDYNGFKISIGTDTIHGTDIQELRDHMMRLVKKGASETLGEGGPTGKVESFDVIPAYMDEVASRFTLPKLASPIKVVLDSGNGTAGPVAPALLRRLGCEVVELFSEPDGRFPNHHPDPTVPENLTHLIEAVRREGADFGVAYDGDADRIGVVDETGDIVWGDRLMVIYSRDILAETPGATIVGEVKCSQVMYDEITRAGGKAVMWKTGHSLIKAKMKELGAAMAGEMSGHIFFADRYYGFDDAVYATCRLVEILASRRAAEPGFRFSSLLAGVHETFVTPEIRLDCPDSEKFSVIKGLDEAIAAAGADGGFEIRDILRIDGLRVNFAGGWALMRASNTQPVIVLRFEADDEETLSAARKFIKERLEEVRPGQGAGL